MFYLNHHRESEDLDFDADISYLKEYKKIEAYFINILEKLKQKNSIKKFSKGKSGLAATNRYHMKLQLETYKTFNTKIDVDFVEIPKNLNKRGELFFYSPERLFVTKMLTFINRNEFKDLYDLAYLIPHINITKFKHNQNVIDLIDKSINTILNQDVIRLFKNAFRNVDLRFKDLKESKVEQFTSKTVRSLRTLRNKLK
ncbi:MAG: nucleotidyl transferase AbiEii/AbiGii toxin family protein [Nanoarchaeota archaeon]|nr:nucleotidyl transferase AbiEii/AbiGii toxin family protein [Nanoarchaeota archaeon]